MKSKIFNSMDSILNLSFLSAFKLTFYTNIGYERAMRCMSYFYMEHLTEASLNTRIAFKSKSPKLQVSGTVPWYSEGVNYLLEPISNDWCNGWNKSWFDAVESKFQ